MKADKVYSLLGLATKANKTASGEFSTDKEIKAGRAALVIVAGDASDNTKKKFRNMCEFYEVPVYFYGTKEELGHSMGLEMRSSMALLDTGFARSVEKHLNGGNRKARGCEQKAKHTAGGNVTNADKTLE